VAQSLWECIYEWDGFSDEAISNNDTEVDLLLDVGGSITGNNDLCQLRLRSIVPAVAASDEPSRREQKGYRK
jgi:hypothetical protein